MITLHFNIDPRHLVFHTITGCSPNRFIEGQPVADGVAFQNRAWQVDRDAYGVFRFGIPEKAILSKAPLEDLIKRADKFLEEMTADPAFKPIFDKTTAALTKVREEWEANSHKTHEAMAEMTGLDLSKEFNVYITHPSQKQGANLEGTILWTYRLDWPNYNTVYLWHEIMHSFVHPENAEDKGEVEHAVIQLLTDEELRTRLNGGTYPPLIGHEELRAMETQLLPSWRAYLQQPKKEIKQFVAEAYKQLASTSSPAR